MSGPMDKIKGETEKCGNCKHFREWDGSVPKAFHDLKHEGLCVHPDPQMHGINGKNISGKTTSWTDKGAARCFKGYEPYTPTLADMADAERLIARRGTR